jgi:hypothetical protein
VSDQYNSAQGHSSTGSTSERCVAATRSWLEESVIGLGLCPFAANVHLRNQVRFCVSEQESPAGLVKDLSVELELLQATDPQLCETTLLIHPNVLADFYDYNEFLTAADATLVALGLEGELQIASFHPAYQFAGSAADAIENYSNRSPYPILHILREASVSRAIAIFPGVQTISENNGAILRRLGKAGWQRLQRCPT